MSGYAPVYSTSGYAPVYSIIGYMVVGTIFSRGVDSGKIFF